VNKGLTIIKTAHKPSNIYNFATGETLELAWLKGRNVATLCAIGYPLSFEMTVESLGGNITGKHRFFDHHWFTAQEIEAALKGDSPVITTEKDAVRVRSIKDGSISPELLSKLHVLSIKLHEDGSLMNTIEKLMKNESYLY